MRRLLALVWIGLFAVPVCASFERAITQIDEGLPGSYGEGARTIRAAGENGFKALMLALDDMSEAGRRRGAKLLREMTVEMPTIEKYGNKIVGLLMDIDDPYVQEQLAAMLPKTGARNLSRLLQLAIRGKELPRSAACAAIARIGEPAWPRVRRLLDSPSDSARIAALDILSRTEADASRFEQRVLELCAERVPAVRAAALEAMVVVSTDRKKTLELLLDAYAEYPTEVHFAVRRGLDRIGPEGSRALVGRIRDRDGEGVDLEVGDLRRLGHAHGPEIQRGLESDSPRVRMALLHALRPHVGESGFPETAWAALAALAASQDSAIRLAACRELTDAPLANRAAARKLLARLASDESAPVRALALEHLALHRPESELHSAFRSGLEDDSADVRAAAWLGLHALSDPDRPGLDFLARLLVEHECALAARAISRFENRAEALLPELTRATGSKNTELALEATRAIGRVLRHCGSSGSPAGRRTRYDDLPEPVRTAAERAWAWLATRQTVIPDSKGRGWNCFANGGHPQCDVGVSGLALMALAAGGNHAGSKPHGDAVRDAERYLRSLQQENGRIGRPNTSQGMVQHAIATVALCELLFLGSPDSGRRQCADRAVRFAIASRNPRLGWRYEPRGEQSDTFVTCWMVTALRLGQMAGLTTDPDAFTGARMWIDRMTDPEFGQIGYNVQGGGGSVPVKPGSLATEIPRLFGTVDPSVGRGTIAIGTWARLILPGRKTPATKLTMLAARLMEESPPRWDTKSSKVNMVYWMFGARVFALLPTKNGPSWKANLVRELLANQQSDGSWPADGAWGRQGGRVYSTSMAVLALLAPASFTPDLASGKRSEQQRAAIDRLAFLRRGSDRKLAAAAMDALEGIGR